MASMYMLNIQIHQDDLDNLLAAGDNIVIGKQIGALDVAWFVFPPLLYNTVSWVEDYQVYASATAIQEGAVIAQMASMTAVLGKNYTLGSTGSFTVQDGAPEGSYGVINQNDAPGSSLTFGLAQSAMANDAEITYSPASATSVRFMGEAVIYPSPSASIWVQAGIQSGTAITSPSSRRTPVTFQRGASEMSLVYDGSSGTFRETQS
jgi:hypothetical protein